MVRNRFALLALFYCSTTLSAQVSVDFATQVYPIFSNEGCLPSCHGSNGGLTIGSPAATAYSNIVSQPSSQGLNYIEPGDPSTSYIYMKVTGANGISGSRMPFNNPSYFDDNPSALALLRVWIEEGALAAATTNPVDEPNDRLPTSFSLSQNYPNPFNPSTKIAYELSVPASVTLTIFNLLAREVYSYEQPLLRAGSYTTTWHAKDHSGATVPAGIYLYRLVATPTDGSAPFIEMRKMVLLK